MAGIDPDHKRTLFVLFPHKVRDRKAAKNIHPGIEKIWFTKGGRGGPRRWCHMRFETEELARQAEKELHKKKVKQLHKNKVKQGRLIVADPQRYNNKQKKIEKMPKTFMLYVTNIPKSVKKEEVKAAFTTCRRVLMKRARSRQKIEAMLEMKTLADAQELVADKESHKINGVPVNIRFSTNFLNFMKNSQTTTETENLIGRKELEGVSTMNKDGENVNQDVGGDTSLNKVEENVEKNSHIMQNQNIQIGEQNSSNVNMQEVQKEEEVDEAVYSLEGALEMDDSEIDDYDDDDYDDDHHMEGSEGQ